MIMLEHIALIFLASVIITALILGGIAVFLWLLFEFPLALLFLLVLLAVIVIFSDIKRSK